MNDCIGHGPSGAWPGNQKWGMMCHECHNKLLNGYIFYTQTGRGPLGSAIEYKLVHGVLAIRVLKPIVEGTGKEKD